MVSCKGCGKKVRTEAGEIGIRERDQAYHIICAPRDLLSDATEEWDAILNRGIKYFVDKYSVAERKKGAKAKRQFAYSEEFVRMGKALMDKSRRGKE